MISEIEEENNMECLDTISPISRSLKLVFSERNAGRLRRLEGG